MPLYEYQCKKCKRRVEKIQKFSDSPLTTCEHCGGKLEKLISSPAIQFKGSGWYVTDYARGSSAGGKNSSTDSSDSERKKSGDSSSKSESSTGKSEAKTEPSKPSDPAKSKSKD